MAISCARYILEAIEISNQLIELARQGEENCNHDECLVLYGIILDSASNVRLHGEKRLKDLESEKSFSAELTL